MSHDLFAAFIDAGSSHGTTLDGLRSDGTAEPDWIGKASFKSNPGPARLPHDVDDDDDFGAFEDASPALQQRVESQGDGLPTSAPSIEKHEPPSNIERHSVGRHPFADNMDLLFSADEDLYDAAGDDLNDLAKNPEAAMAYSKQLIAQRAAHQLAVGKTRTTPTARTNVRSPFTSAEVRKQRDPNILFDAEDESEDGGGDFGDFEAGETDHAASSQSSAKRSNESTSGLSNINTTSLRGTTRSGDSTAPFAIAAPGLNPETHEQVVPASLQAVSLSAAGKLTPITQDDDPWDDFEDSAPALTKDNAPDLISNVEFKLSTPLGALPDALTTPTNVPPPIILLSVFPSLFETANTILLQPMSVMDDKQRQALVNHGATQKFLRTYLANSIVLGHVIAGRKFRWKRDQYLSQGMRIGPAGLKGKGGMKLASVDKSETVKEDREVVDVVRQWKAQVGKLRSVVTAASLMATANHALVVPEISEQMPVKALKPAEGGVIAPRPCVLCGLRREERVAKVDVGIDDSFGEWWVQGVDMHLTCRNFWEEHNAKLRSR